jgi:hypothetical protein
MNLYVILALVLWLTGFGGGMYLKGRIDEANSNKTTVLTETVKDQEKLNEIRNNRPDGAGVAKRLRAGSF